MELAGARVLIVEDEAMIAMMIEDYFIDLGCEVVVTAGCLEDAEEKARTARIDFATLDINLGGLLSYPVAQILVSRSIPFVFSSGYGRAGIPPELRYVPVLSKPFARDQLAKAVRSAKKPE